VRGGGWSHECVCLQSTGSNVIKGRQIRRIANWKPLSRTQPSRELEAPGKVIDRGSACKPRSVRRGQRFTALRLCAPRQARSAPLRAFVPPLPRLGDHLSAPGRYRRARAAYPGLERSGQLLAPAWPCSGWGLPGRPIAGTAGGLLHHRFTLAPRSRAERFISVALSAGLPARVLPGTLPCGARTFLDPSTSLGAAIAWPTHRQAPS